MEISPLAKKLQVKPGQHVLIYNAPDYYISILELLPQQVTIAFTAAGSFTNVQLFVQNSIELEKTLKIIHGSLTPDSVFWIMYPKKTSGILSDLEMTSSWKEPGNYGLRPVASVSVDNTWTAIRFKPIDQVKPSGVGNADIKNNELGKYIDLEKRVITLPADLRQVLEQQPSSIEFFENLAWSHKKEYITWILSAKQEKTRAARILKTVEMLAAKKKNPSDK